jgi:hypothetical protein
MKTWIKIVIALGILGIIAGVLVYKFYINKPHPDYENMEPAYRLSAQDLFNAYTANQTSADSKYNGQLLELNGILNKVETTDSLVTLVFIFDKGDFGDAGVRCTMLPNHNEEAKKLKPDGTVKIKGYCTGFTNDVVLEQCSIVE